MKLELPKLRRCCFCLPLRYGLIICGYLRLILLLLMFVVVICSFINTPRALTTTEILIKSIFLLLLMVDTCLTIVFLVGGHRKTTKLIHTFYIYNIVLLCIITLFFTWAVVSDLYNIETLSKLFGYTYYISIIQIDILMGILFLGMQIYIILLIRSEADKLRNNTNCRFDNLAAEAKCTLEHESHKNGVNDSNTDITKGCGTDC